MRLMQLLGYSAGKGLGVVGAELGEELYLGVDLWI